MGWQMADDSYHRITRDGHWQMVRLDLVMIANNEAKYRKLTATVKHEINPIAEEDGLPVSYGACVETDELIVRHVTQVGKLKHLILPPV